MIKQEIKFEDFNGEKCTEIAYFGLTQSELTEMELTKEGGLANYYQSIVDTQNVPELARVFKDLIMRSYGVKSDDGKKFVKIAPDGHLLANDFVQSAAYDAFYMDLVTDADKAAAFFNGIVPKMDNLTQIGNK